ncbi:MAG: CBS domain-containing protein [Actinobacteria bacterium]|nr:CBS domain-containing protein [Actinomycetota bacterium]
MPRTTPVAEVMTTDVLRFSPTDTVRDAMRAMVEADVDGAPVTDESGRVVGLLSTDDLIVRESRLHFPTVIELLGGVIELPGQAKRFDEEIRRALGSTVGDVMSTEVSTVSPDDTLETAASLMHDRRASRLPVVRAGVLVGIIGQGDVVRAILRDEASEASAE